MPVLPSTPVTDLLFVYGTLRQAARNEFAQYLHQRSTYVGTGQMKGRLYRIDWFPGAVYDPLAPTTVVGDVFSLHQPTDTLSYLDAYEEVTNDDAGVFVRQLVRVQQQAGPVTAWTYLYHQPVGDLPLIDGGDFAPYV